MAGPRNSRPGLVRGLYLIPAGLLLIWISALSGRSTASSNIGAVAGFVTIAGLLWGVVLLVLWPMGLLARKPGTPPREGGPYLVVGLVTTGIGLIIYLANLAGQREVGLAAGLALLTIGLTLTTVGGWRMGTRYLSDPAPAATGTAWVPQPPPPPATTSPGPGLGTVTGAASTVPPPPPGDTPAGWYPNPDGPGRRYWDGTTWTPHTAPDAPQP